jgi:hypothetical protein
VYFTYAAALGHAMIDRELYLPKSFGLPMCRWGQPGVKGYTHRVGSPCIRL